MSDRGLELNIAAPETRITQFADLILPLPIPNLFTYRIPVEMEEETQEGKRVIVQFGRRKILTGVIIRIHDSPPSNYEAKYILDILDQVPSFCQVQLDLIFWMASYYMCTPGEVLAMAMPSGLKLSSESKIQLNPDYSIKDYEFSDQEEQLWGVLQQKDLLDYNTAGEVLGIKNINPVLKSMIKKGAIILLEQVKDRYRPKVRKHIRFKPDYLEETKLQDLFSKLSQKPKQEAILLRLLHLMPVLNTPTLNTHGVAKVELLDSDREILSSSSLKTLIKNEILEDFDVIVSRFDEFIPDDYEINLTEAQQKAHLEIHEGFQKNNTVLFQGVTGSGKTEIYISLIQEILEQGGQVLYLLPEIALTTQIVRRLRKVFGDQMGVFHSKYSANERVEVWNGVISGKFQLVVGVRSSIFLPFDNLDLIIVDEEHEPSYKAFDPAPRYHARDTALKLASLHHAKTILGSATPSMESYYLANQGKFSFVSLKERYGNARLPSIELVDIERERKQKRMREHFSSVLMEEMELSLNSEQQVIIFQNRRGYAPYLTCEECHWIPKCTQCSVSLTYHRYQNELVCHYCGQRQKPPSNCIACGSVNIRNVSFGTEKLEEDLQQFFPDARIQRMDLDTTRSKYSYEQIINDFSEGKTQLLVGTQMITKGLDFNHVNLVGVLDSDRMMNFPDFRSFERTFQLLVQVAGRSGRREIPGKVLIQTSHPAHPLFQKVIEHDYESFYQEELSEREKFNYPPFTRLIKVILKHPDRDIAYQASHQLSKSLANRLGSQRILGPQEPVIHKIRNKFLMDILIKLEKDKVNLGRAKALILESIDEVRKLPNFSKVIYQLNVDPI